MNQIKKRELLRKIQESISTSADFIPDEIGSCIKELHDIVFPLLNRIYFDDFAVAGNDAAKICDIVGYFTFSTYSNVRNSWIMETTSEYVSINDSEFQSENCDKVVLEGCEVEEDNGEYIVNSIVDLEGGQWAIYVTGLTGGSMSGNMNYFVEGASNKLILAESLNMSYGETLTINGSDSSDGTYNFITETEISENVWHIEVYQALSDSPVTPGEVWSIASISNLVVEHNLNSVFICVDVMFMSEQYSGMTEYLTIIDENSISIDSSFFMGTEVGTSGQIHITKFD